MLKAYSASYKKESRAVNEDSFGLIADKFYMVADGISSSPNGAAASQEAVRLFAEYFGRLSRLPSLPELHQFLLDTGRQVDRASDGSHTTVAAVWFPSVSVEPTPFVGLSVGDSRIYILDTLGEPKLRQLSRDHVTSIFDRRQWRVKTVLTASCGGEPLPDIRHGLVRHVLARGEWLIIATDGVWGFLEKNREWFLASVPQFQQKPADMVDILAMLAARQQRDDATVMIIRREE